MKIEKDLYNNLINISYSIIIAGFIVILITTGSANQNALTALISGYCAVLVAFIFFITVNWINMENLYMYPLFKLLAVCLVISGIIVILISYLSIYFDRISSNKVSSYYYSFSQLSTLFLAVQLIMLFSVFFITNKGQQGTGQQGTGQLITGKSIEKTFSIILLLGLINIIIVTTMGIVLKFYTTQC